MASGWHIMTGILLVALAACQGREGAEVNYGLLAQPLASSFMSLGPTDTVFVCGTNQRGLRDSVATAISTWARAAGRSSLRVKTGDSCENFYSYPAAVATGVEDCGKGVVGFRRSLSARHSLIASCRSYFDRAAQSILAKNMLHEVGHTYGLCDQYPDSSQRSDDTPWVSHNANCRSPMKSASAQISIMNGLSENLPDTLTADDLLAVQLYACRADVAVNRSWLTMLPAKTLHSWKTDSFRREMAQLQRKGYRFLPECQ